MFTIPCLNCAKHVDRGNIQTGKSAIVHDLLDARARRSDLGRQIGQPTRSIANDGGESAEPSVRDKTSFNHATKPVGIDVSAAKQKNDSLSR